MKKEELKNKYNRVACDNSQLQGFAYEMIDAITADDNVKKYKIDYFDDISSEILNELKAGDVLIDVENVVYIVSSLSIVPRKITLLPLTYDYETFNSINIIEYKKLHKEWTFKEKLIEFSRKYYVEYIESIPQEILEVLKQGDIVYGPDECEFTASYCNSTIIYLTSISENIIKNIIYTYSDEMWVYDYTTEIKIPTPTISDEGKVVTVNSYGEYELKTPSAGGTQLYLHNYIFDNGIGDFFIRIITQIGTKASTFTDVTNLVHDNSLDVMFYNINGDDFVAHMVSDIVDLLNHKITLFSINDVGSIFSEVFTENDLDLSSSTVTSL